MAAGGGGSDAARKVTFDLNGLLSTQDALTVKVATQANWLQSTSKAVAGDNTGVMYLGAAIALAWLVRCCFGGQENQEEGKLEQRLAGVVEIGCGHGLCGALARKLLPTTVPCVLTDGNERALDLARGTVEANGSRTSARLAATSGGFVGATLMTPRLSSTSCARARALVSSFSLPTSCTPGSTTVRSSPPSPI